MRRRLARLALLALLVIVTFFYPLLAPTAHRIDQAHFDLIEDGMTKAELEAIFGVPAGDYDWARPAHSDLFALVAAPDLDLLIEWNNQTSTIELASAISQIAFTRIEPDSRESLPPSIWVGRRGACIIHFDDRRQVTRRRYFWPHTDIEPPWTRWWATLRGQQ